MKNFNPQYTISIGNKQLAIGNKQNIYEELKFLQ